MAKQEKNEDLEKTKRNLQRHIHEIKSHTELPKDSFQEKWEFFEETVEVIVGASTSCPKSKVFIELMLNEFKEKLEELNRPSKRRRRRRRIQDNALNSDSEDEDEKDYDVKKVIAKHIDNNGKVKYGIVWANTWEPKDQLNCDEKIAAYEENPNKTDVRKIKGKDVDKDGNVLYKTEWEDTWEPKDQLCDMQGCGEKITSYENSLKRKSEQKTSNDDDTLSKRSKHSSSPHGRRSPKFSPSTPSNQRSSNSYHRSTSSSYRPSTSGKQNQESNSSSHHRSSSSSRPSPSHRQNQESNSSSHRSSSSSRPSSSNAQNQDSRSHTSHQYSSSRSSNSTTHNRDSRNHSSHQYSSSRPSTSREVNKESCWERNNEYPCPKSFRFKFIPYHSSSFQNKGSGNYLCTLNMEITAQILDIFKKEKRLWPTDFKLFPTKDCSRNIQLKTKTVRFKPSQYDHQIGRKEPETLVEIEFFIQEATFDINFGDTLDIERIANSVFAQAKVPTDIDDQIWKISEEEIKSLDQFTLDFDCEQYLSFRVTKNSTLKIGTDIDANQIKLNCGFVKIVNRGPIHLYPHPDPYKNWIVGKVMVKNMAKRRDQFKLFEGTSFGKIHLKRFEQMPMFERDSRYLEPRVKKEIKTEPYPYH